MESFFPSGIKFDDIQNPKQILEVARKDWEAKTNGVLGLILTDGVSQNEDALIFVDVVDVPKSRTARLLTVIHRPASPYPVAIDIDSEELPSYLKKSYYAPSMAEMMRGNLSMIGSKGGVVQNEWVAESPNEFRTKLREAFNSGEIKGILFNLLSSEMHGYRQSNVVLEVDSSAVPNDLAGEADDE